MKVKIFRLDSRNGFEDWLSAAKDNPDVEVDYILENPEITKRDERNRPSDDYYLHGTYDRNERFVERIGYWCYLGIIFDDGSICYNTPDMPYKEFIDYIDQCLKAGTAGIDQEYVDIEDLVF